MWRRPNGLTSTGTGIVAPSRSTRLSAVMTVTRRRAARRDDLLAEQGPAPALDHPELRVDLVGAVEVEVERLDVVELAQRDPERRGQLGGRDAGGDADEARAPRRRRARPRRRTISAAVVPEPSPTIIPSSTSAAAASAARSFAGIDRGSWCGVAHGSAPMGRGRDVASAGRDESGRPDSNW